MTPLLASLRQLLRQPGEKRRLVTYWFLVFSFLVVLPSIGFVLEIMFNQPILSMAERLTLVFSLYANSFRFLFEPVTFSVVLLSIVLALNFLMIRFVQRSNQVARGRLRSTVTMLVSGHCIACGGSLLAPLTSLLTGSASYYSSERFMMVQILSVGLNMIAMAIALWSMQRAARTVQRVLLSTQTTMEGSYI